MSTIPKFCSYCLKFIDTNKDRCSKCGFPFELESQEAFLSGTFKKQTNVVTLPEGHLLMDRFKIKNLLGNGHIGSVYLSEDMQRSMEVALKIVGLGSCNSEKDALRLQREMNIHSKISEFKHVIRIFDLHLATLGGSGLLVLSMEYADGGNFRGLLKDLSDDGEIRRVVGLNHFISACYGVAEIHEANVIHLDLKPENLVFVGNILKVSDFGSAICDGHFDSTSYQNSGSWPLEKGTPEYMSPEHFSASCTNELDKRADIYSLGIILYEILHPKCSTPFNGPYSRLRNLHTHAPVPGISVGDEFSAVIDRCLQKNPSERYQNVRELIDDIEDKKCNNTCSNQPRGLKSNAVNHNQEKNLGRALLLFSQGKYNESIDLLDEILLELPDLTRAIHLREKIRVKYEQAENFYEEIGQNNMENDLNKLIELLKEAVSVYPDHPRGRLIQVKLSALTERYRKVMEEGGTHFTNGSWEAALGCFQEARDINSAARNLNNIIRPLSKITDMRRQINQALIQKDFSAALRLAHLVDLEVEHMKNRTPSTE